MSEKDILKEVQRSQFVTAIAWVYIVFCGFAAVIGLMQNIMMFFLFQTEELNRGFIELQGTEHLPEFAKFVFGNFQLVAFAMFLVSLATFISAVGLLKRKNWARIVFIVLMSFGILWALFFSGMQFVMFDSLVIPAGAQDPPELKTAMYIFQVVSLIFVAAFIALFAWIIRKLMSAEVRAEFA